LRQTSGQIGSDRWLLLCGVGRTLGSSLSTALKQTHVQLEIGLCSP
jgi:hypothetical protein